MKRWLAIVLMSLLFGAPVWAAGPVLPQIFKSTANGDSRKIDVVPDPGNLRSDWFRYFNVEGDELANRIKVANELLTRRYGPQSQLYGARRSSQIDRIRVNLEAYLAAQAMDVPQSLPAPGVVDQYTPSQALELVAALRQARQDAGFEKNDVAAMGASVKTTQQSIDQRMASYLQMNETNPDKLDSGFQIMAKRTAVATTELQLISRRAAAELREKQVKELKQAEALAEQRLVATPAEIERLGTEITRLEPLVDEQRELVFNEERRVLQSSAVTLEDEVAGRYRKQRAIRASVSLESSLLQLEGLRTQRALSEMLVGGPDVSLPAVRKQLDALRDAETHAKQNIRRWLNDSERERDRAGAGLSSNNTVQTPIGLMNQDRLRLAQDSVSALAALSAQLVQIDYLRRWTSRTMHNQEGILTRIGSTASEWGSAAVGWTSGITDRSLFKLGSTPITLVGLFKLVLIILFAWLLSWIFRRLLASVGHRFEKEKQSLLFIISRLAHYLIIGIGIIAGLSSIGLSFANFALVAGALALGLGFGLQSIVNNFLSGLILFFERTVKVGDFVELENGLAGEIKSINVRGTIVNTNDNVDVVVPNSQFTERQVINWTLLDPFRRIHVPFRVAYEADEDKVVEAGLEAAGKLSSTLTGVLGREPSVWLVNYGENGLEFELIVWLMPDAVKRPEAIFAAYHWEIKKALNKHQIEVPVPQREVRVRPGSPSIGHIGGAS